MSDPSFSIALQDVEPRRSAAAWAGRVKPVFLVSLLLCTWLPMAFFLLSARLEGAMFGYAGTRTLLLFLGTAHVPATLFFYIDKDFSEIIRKHKARYIYFPILLTITTGLLFAFASTLVQAYILLAYWSWQAFHYGRQNLGIYSFVAIAQRGSAPSKNEKLSTLAVMFAVGKKGASGAATVKLPVSVLLPRFWKETSSPGCPGSAKLAR